MRLWRAASVAAFVKTGGRSGPCVSAGPTVDKTGSRDPTICPSLDHCISSVNPRLEASVTDLRTLRRSRLPTD